MVCTVGAMFEPSAAPGQEKSVAARCETCHADRAPEVSQSVHAALGCNACHEGEKSYPLTPDQARTWSTAGQAARPAFDHGPSFSGKPTRADTPNFCGDCHANVERMNPYGLRTDQLARYWTSGHGKTLRDKKDDRVAVCIDCHGSHDIRAGKDPASRTYPVNVVSTCGSCHTQASLMAEFGLHVEVVDEYRESVHGDLLLNRGDTGAPNCATCHGNHSATPPGFATVGAVCGQCHQHASLNFSKSIHSTQPEFDGCIQCHGGGEDRRGHLIERITKPTGVLIERYAHLLTTEPHPTPEQVTQSINPDPRKIIEHALPACGKCHDDPNEDESVRKLLTLLDDVAAAERRYVQTAAHLDRVGQGVLLVGSQRFAFEDAKTHLIELAPLQHTLDNKLVAAKVAELNTVCDQVSSELAELETGLQWRRRLLVPIWLFAVAFATACYVKYKRLKAEYVKPAGSAGGHHR